jgi:hypothetical protein
MQLKDILLLESSLKLQSGTTGFYLNVSAPTGFTGDINDTIALLDLAQTLSNKTFTGLTVNESASTANSDSFPITFRARNASAVQVSGTIAFDGPTSRFQFDGVTIPTISSSDTLTNKTLTSPTVNGGSLSDLTKLGIVDAGTSFELILASNSTTDFTADRTLTIDLDNANKTLKLDGSPTLSGITTTGTGTLALTASKTLTVNESLTLEADSARTLKISGNNKEIAGAATLLTFGGNFTTSGAHTTTLTTGGDTSLTLPINGTVLSAVASGTADSTWVAANAGRFYLGSVNPLGATRLNYNGQLQANSFAYIGGALAVDKEILYIASTGANTSSEVDISGVYIDLKNTGGNSNIGLFIDVGGAETNTAIQVNTGNTILQGLSAQAISGTTGTFSGAINKVTITAPANGSTLTIADGKTLTANESITLTGDQARTLTINGANKTIGGTGTSITITGTPGLSGTGTATLTENATFTKALTVNTGTVTLQGNASGSSVILPASGTLATIAGSEALTNKSINGLTISSSTGVLTIANGKTLTVSNTLEFTGTDSSSVAFGGGGTVAYTGGNLSQFAATTSSQLAGVISDETGSGSLVFGTSPTIATPTITTSLATTSSSFSLINLNATTVNFAGASTSLTMGASSAGFVSIRNTSESSSTTTGALRVAGGIGVVGNVYIGGDLFFSSDERLKTKIEKIEPQSISEKISSLDIWKYVYTADKKETKNIGLMAQDLERIFPEISEMLVDSNNDEISGLEDKKSIKETKLSYVLWLALQEEISHRKSIEKRLKDLEEKIK